MFTHIFVGTNNPEAARTFYNATMGVLGYRCSELPNGAAYVGPDGKMIICTPHNGEPAGTYNGLVLAFTAADCAAVDAWYAAGLEAGGTNHKAPEFNPRSPGTMYCAYLRDPDGILVSAYAPNPNPPA